MKIITHLTLFEVITRLTTHLTLRGHMTKDTAVD